MLYSAQQQTIVPGGRIIFYRGLHHVGAGVKFRTDMESMKNYSLSFPYENIPSRLTRPSILRLFPRRTFYVDRHLYLW